MLQEAILITGAGQRIGLFLAKQFLEQGEYPVVFTYRTRHAAVSELESLGALGFQVDFTQPETVSTFLNELKEKVGSLRALIHNASIWANDAMVDENPDLYTAMFQLHVEVPYRLNIALRPLLEASKSPMKDIICLSDSSAGQAYGDYSAYLASKAALQSLSRSFAQKYAPVIKVNDIAPGLIIFNEHDSEAYKQQRLQRSLLGIEPGAQVIWQAVQYLLNSAYTTGVSLPVDGGRKIL
ncbi:MAG: dihydromonapterin reductase [Thiomicrorhabdus chilensis]|uniref:dihydromonapterin reductase n=1 Tax=Thiomicrorhabdus chilensis TaxID=63656 RepID=UPI00299F0D27|nr:dihydromonapterin reductase [Thiomicrorhabdus chilensis]MDX1347786.1 dihydromonapterin reductase [Thiomicrorhabdus chilensis]